MEDAVKKSLELEAQMKGLEEAFQQGVREKERMFDELGITPERLAAFEKKLTPEDKAAMAKIAGEMEAELERAAAAPSPAAKSAPKVKGMRV
ncbi:hypothetical protein TDMWS_20250 [Thermodesulfomicrobium sp. WS]|uniref:hypothetical protein n=1 Tax=Thermodesulfomicrobium sp. WS TaxID=3004129 RepID=UPI00248FB11E|nr:hypothetical protein [Thermodesulfomicrobium sp. WS]BDV01940.1 hypothetical protein TDMWS_20250 [Thermodesulfomicrobium sp. WS]